MNQKDENPSKEISVIDARIDELRKIKCPGQTPEFWQAVADKVKLSGQTKEQ